VPRTLLPSGKCCNNNNLVSPPKSLLLGLSAAYHLTASGCVENPYQKCETSHYIEPKSVYNVCARRGEIVGGMIGMPEKTRMGNLFRIYPFSLSHPTKEGKWWGVPLQAYCTEQCHQSNLANNVNICDL